VNAIYAVSEVPAKKFKPHSEGKFVKESLEMLVAIMYPKRKL
jgi:hypothetical protein